MRNMKAQTRLAVKQTDGDPGTLHRLLLTRALMLDPWLLLLDEPFAGLDAHSRATLLRVLDILRAEGTGVVLATAQPDDLPESISHVIEVREHRIVYAGPRRQTRPPGARRRDAVSTHDSLANGRSVRPARGKIR
jgi:ABC-type Mn2+/Zn2+ transport system ATPase subunit